ncbi:hypothetical protein K470DRAFT_269299 [Piedraia hortae CBS 480.64]|uniref:Zn(2)-C6 fungal-type domain-containing protein n=1 Tax=Piedraia hortae CBS 480.64 TaxID=1314780 RepID=A0A6A7C3I8_9PEZI|nr:hypothetical protein K470DRAFT_269299 [Piedraia hortae CBS 480.64]
MSQPFGGPLDYHPQQPRRSIPPAAPYYHHQPPYSIYGHTPQYGHQMSGRMPMDENDTTNGHTRRRIAVACSRCRRRKIKCSGDPGDGTGCQACRASGADVDKCNFIRVGSHQVAVGEGVEACPSSEGEHSTTNHYTFSSAVPGPETGGSYRPGMDDYRMWGQAPLTSHPYVPANQGILAPLGTEPLLPSLPSRSAQDRRLPIPTTPYSNNSIYSTDNLPELAPLGVFGDVRGRGVGRPIWPQEY